jgi:hypothetical protein
VEVLEVRGQCPAAADRADPVTAYTAPASKVFTEAHIRCWCARCRADGPWTVCGEQMLAAECWQPVTLRPGERVCKGCAAPGDKPEAAPVVQEGLL